MRTSGRPSRRISTAIAFLTAVFGTFAVSVVSMGAQPIAGPRIGDARVDVGQQTARVVEQVGYRDGVSRIADALIDGGTPATLINDPDLAQAWRLVESVWPTSLRGQLKQISLIDEGSRGLVGVVHRSSSGGWILSIDRSDLWDHRLVQETIIHEIAHMVTLGPDDFTFNLGVEDDRACEGVSIAVGCARASSLMARYASRFWPDGIVDATSASLVDEYAATAAHEDLAETFTAWVADWTISSSAVESRMEFLAGDPVMSSLEAEIGNRLD